jgi:EmrB/QacA subfamily drug resistance transporter
MKVNENKWRVLSAASLSFFLVNFDSGIISVLLPTLQEAYKAEFSQVQWVWLAGLLTIVVTLAIVGRLGDVRGRKGVFVAGSLLYIIGTFLVILAPSVPILTTFRVIQGLGISAFLALGTALVTEAFGEQERGKALGIYNLLGLVGILAGPILTGVLIERYRWSTVFIIGIGIAALTLIASIAFLKPAKPSRRGAFDLAGSVMLFIALGTLLMALTLGQDMSFLNPTVLLLFLLSVLAFLGFLRIERKTQEPMIALDFFKNRTFSINLVLLLFSMVALSGYGFLLPFYLQNIVGLSTTQMGVLLAIIFGLLMAIMAPVGGTLSDRVGSWPVTLIGLALLLGGTLAASTLTEVTTQAAFLLRFAPVGLGIGLIITPTTSAIMGTLPGERLGMGSSLVSITLNTAQTIGIALLGTFWSAQVGRLVGVLPAGGASLAPADIQLEALRNTFFFAAVIVSIGIVLNVWGMTSGRKKKSA